ncbi:hypothetical protein E1180_14675 [Roseibium denhamense]|uniref:CheA signal transduction histidine kinase n=1 Tax=Roseibium denhamense TaxID=76305 RepID=A0ABY1NJ63_9HYPH|nr:hypothetical protein [Roseibium denhamense]MTI06758.1 hypothetical protein [Roseibium denhamense]SMP11066.1 hypothetical protein SAMN06265374_1283 [Roseibium denhamense]
MADYYSILKKTIASLPESNGAARRSVYSRARNAIVNQLKAYEPPLSPSEITAEQLRLEEAIRKVEAEAARESLGLGPAPSASKPGAVAPTVEPPAPAPQPAVSSQPVEPPSPSYSQPVDTTVAKPGSDAAGASQPGHAPLKEELAEAETLGGAASEAVQQTREAVETPGQPQADQQDYAQRQEPVFNPAQADDQSIFEDRGPEDAAGPSASHFEQNPDSDVAAPGARDKRDRKSASEALKPKGLSGNTVLVGVAAAVLLLLVGAGAYFFLSAEPSDPAVSAVGVEPSPVEEDTQPVAAAEPQAAEPDTDPADDASDPSKNTDRLLNDSEDGVVAPDARSVTTTLITPPSEDAQPAQPSIVTNVESTPAPVTPEPVPGVDDPGASAPEETPLAAVAPDAVPAEPESNGGAQRSILYEEGEDSGGAGTAAQGAVVWNLDEETGLNGQSQAVLNASVEIPERDVKVDIRIKPNDDTSLPASHLVEIKYELPDSFAAGDIVNVPGLVMKPTEEARGDALIGASVKVSPGYFWIALSSLPNEQERNLALLRERGWIDIPMLYENGKRGILTLEKGSIGADAVERAITAWNAG